MHIKKSIPPKILIYREIRITIPRKFLLKCYAKEQITLNDIVKVRAISAQFEKKLCQLRHAQSVADKILLMHTHEFEG